MGNQVRLSVAHICLSRGFKGNERMIELLMKELANIGVPQVLVCRSDSPLIPRMTEVKGLKIIKIPGLSDPRFTGHFRLARECSLIHAHESHGANWAFVHYIMYNTPFIYTHYEAGDLGGGFFRRSAFNSASRIIGISSEMSARIEKEFPGKCETVTECASHYRANRSNVARLREAFKNRFIVCQIAPLISREKGQNVLIDAARKLKNTLPDLVVLLVGSGDDANHLRSRADGLPNVKFLGFKRNYIDYLAGSDIIVHPVYTEHRGGMLLDAMEQGTPIIASNVGAVKDIVRDGVTGLIVPPDDADSLASCILRLKRNADLRKNLVANGLNEAETRNSASMAAEYYRIYFSVLNERK